MITHEWSYPEGTSAENPTLPKNLKKLELLSLGEVQEQKVDGKSIFRQQGLYTCFDSGYYQIPGLAWKVNTDSIISNPLFIQIELFAVDTTLEIREIEGPLSVPYTLAELAPYIGASVLAMAFLVGLYIFLKRRKKNELAPKEPPKPPHIIAFEKLDELKNKKLWQQDLYKEYYVQLSFIIKEYLENRYKTGVLNLTTDELTSLCLALKINKELVLDLAKYLKIGDLVKFAKAKPMPFENEEALNIALQIVKETMVQPNEENVIEPS